MKKCINNSILVMLAMILMISCTDHFEELNTPPTSVTEIDPALVFSNVQRTMMYEGVNPYWKTNTMQYGAWVQHWGMSDRAQTAPFYIPMRDWHDTDWEWHYEQLKELSRVRALLTDNVENGDVTNPEIRSKYAMAKLLEVHIAERISGLLGDVPYSEAAQGLEGTLNPRYDPQSEIYPSLLDTLDKYIPMLTPGDFTFGDADFFYSGDIATWQKFGNSLKLRVAMRMKYADPQAAESAVTEAMNAPLLQSNSESASIPTTSGGGPDFQAHPILAIFRQPVGKSMLGETLIEKLKAKDDPRLTLIAEPTANSKEVFAQTGDPNDLEYRGLPHAMTADQADQIIVDDYSLPSSSIFVNEDVARPIKVLMYPEVAFLQAEAALEGWGADPSDAEMYYREGITAALSMFPFNVSQSDIDAYMANNNEGRLNGPYEQNLEKIMTQKWLHFFDQEMQAYLEWRRTGYPQLDPGDAQGVTNGNIPRRGLYHRSEQSLNSESYSEAINRQGPDELTTKTWLDQNDNNGQL